MHGNYDPGHAPVSGAAQIPARFPLVCPLSAPMCNFLARIVAINRLDIIVPATLLRLGPALIRDLWFTPWRGIFSEVWQTNLSVPTPCRLEHK